MKKIMIAMAIMMSAVGMNAQDEAIIDVYVSPENGLSYAIAQDSNDQTVTVISNDKKGKSRSTSVSVSSSGSGRSKASTSASANGSAKGVKSFKDLAIAPLFEKYKRHRNASLTVIDNPSNVFMELKITDNPEIVKEITSLVEKDEKVAYNMVKTYKEYSDDITMNIWVGDKSCSIGFKINSAGTICTLFISGSPAVIKE